MKNREDVLRQVVKPLMEKVEAVCRAHSIPFIMYAEAITDEDSDGYGVSRMKHGAVTIEENGTEMMKMTPDMEDVIAVMSALEGDRTFVEAFMSVFAAEVVASAMGDRADMMGLAIKRRGGGEKGPSN